MSVTAGKPGRRIAVVGSGRQCIFSMYTREIVRIVRSVGGKCAILVNSTRKHPETEKQRQRTAPAVQARKVDQEKPEMRIPEAPGAVQICQVPHFQAVPV